MGEKKIKRMMLARKLSILALKYLPIVAAAVMVNHCVWALFFGVELHIAAMTVTIQLLPALILFLVSEAFGFCWLHKLFVIYDALSSIAISYHANIGFVNTLVFHRVLFLLVGITLFVMLAIKHKAFSFNCGCYECCGEIAE